MNTLTPQIRGSPSSLFPVISSSLRDVRLMSFAKRNVGNAFPDLILFSKIFLENPHTSKSREFPQLITAAKAQVSNYVHINSGNRRINEHTFRPCSHCSSLLQLLARAWGFKHMYLQGFPLRDALKFCLAYSSRAAKRRLVLHLCPREEQFFP